MAIRSYRWTCDNLIDRWDHTSATACRTYRYRLAIGTNRTVDMGPINRTLIDVPKKIEKLFLKISYEQFLLINLINKFLYLELDNIDSS